jgi:hypothetical protein
MFFFGKSVCKRLEWNEYIFQEILLDHGNIGLKTELACKPVLGWQNKNQKKPYFPFDELLFI